MTDGLICVKQAAAGAVPILAQKETPLAMVYLAVSDVETSDL